MKNLEMFAFLLCIAALSLMANQISSPKRLGPWTNQKAGHQMRSVGRSGYSGMEGFNSSHQGNLSKIPHHGHQVYKANQGQSNAKTQASSPTFNASSSSSSFSSSSSSSSSLSSSSSSSSDGRNSSDDILRFIQFDQPHFDLDNRHANFQQGECKYPCPCTPSSAPPVCKAGVNTVMDGCGCCPQCGRQMGDLCNFRDKCDEQKSLFCDFKLDGGFRGYCRARNPRACNISGKTITDGQTYQPNCSLMCTCQDGKYACSSLCPQELRPPSPTYCRDAQLVSVKAQCCKEWVCPNPHNYPSLEDTLSSQYPNEKACNKEVTEWSMCSVSCGLGESIRVTSDNEECQARQERRLCIVRPCGPMTELSMEQPSRRKDATHHSKKPDAVDKKYSNKNNLSPSSGVKCRATIESPKWENIQYEECVSEQTFQLRYCSTCRKCCGPEKTRTVEVKFQCPENKTLLKPFMFIEKCVCYKAKNCPFS